MLSRDTIGVCVATGIASFSLLLLIISAGVPVWLDNGQGDTIGLFRKCFSDDAKLPFGYDSAGCYNENRVTQAGLLVFGILLLSGAIIAAIASVFVKNIFISIGAFILMYFSSMFVMSAYATWGTYSRDPYLYVFPASVGNTNSNYTSMGSAYHLCVAAHYFLWTALTLFAVAFGYALKSREETQS